MGSEAVDGSEEGLRLEDHALPAPEGPVVDRPVAVTGVGSEVVNPDGNQVLPDSLSHHAELERALEEPRKDSDDIELEGFRSGHRFAEPFGRASPHFSPGGCTLLKSATWRRIFRFRACS